MILKKILFGIFVCSQLTLTGQIGFGNAQKVNEDWKFILQDNQNFQAPYYDDSKWETINIPHDWSVKGQLNSNLASATGYLPGGIGWYRKSLKIPTTKSGQKVYLYFEGVYNRSEIFINGKSLGKRPNGYISFAHDVTAYVNYGQENTIAVRVDHSKSADSRWYTGSGIYRNVWLVYANPIHMAQWGVYAYPEMQDNSGILNVEVDVVNQSDNDTSISIINELIDAKGKSKGKTSNSIQLSANSSNKTSTELKIDNPQLWSLENPNLYQLKTTILQDGDLVDETITQTGFRKFTFNPNKGFALNDEWMKVKGVCLHHDAGVLGSAVPKEVWKSRLETLKELGVNAIRTSHNPQAPDLYDLCDELGLLVLNEAYDEWEFPKRKWLEGWNVGTPGFEGSYDIFADWAEKDLEDFVRRDRNHLSVFAWSIGNEVDYPNDPYSHPVLDGGGDTGFSQAVYGGFKKEAPDAMRLGAIAKRLVKAVKKYDNSRPVTAGLAGVAMSNETEYPGALDITGYNYTESKYQSDHEKYPNRVIYGSENRHDLEAWKAVTENEHIFGQFLWTGIDYLGESGRWPSRGFYSGLVDLSGNIKPRGYFRQSLWSNKPMIYVGTYPIRNRNRRRLSIDAWPVWSYESNQTIRVVCYTNVSKAHLELNGKIVGEEKVYDNETGIIFWDIPFQSGKLEAVGLSEKNDELSRYTIETPKTPYALEARIENDKKVISKNSETILVRIELVDEHGVLANLSENEITCNIEGPAKLLGMEAGNNQDMSDYTDNTQAAFRGKILAYIQATGDSGNVKVTFSSPLLKPVEINFETK
ncbi:sugar-binding domain-containing protein [Flavobacteriaceae bacterium SZ-1-7]|uniref:sugar-binding domain-containing protein n=1 Tax=Tamlana sedimenti TaxID=3134126 RepID=UPI0031243FBE